jgi:hypothetical protein
MLSKHVSASRNTKALSSDPRPSLAILSSPWLIKKRKGVGDGMKLLFITAVSPQIMADVSLCISAASTVIGKIELKLGGNNAQVMHGIEVLPRAFQVQQFEGIAATCAAIRPEKRELSQLPAAIRRYPGGHGSCRFWQRSPPPGSQDASPT